MPECIDALPSGNIRRATAAPTSVRVGSFDTRLDVWFVDLDVGADAIRSFRELLSDDELEKAEGIRFALHRDRYITGRAAMRRVLADHLCCSPTVLRFSYGPYGKPMLGGCRQEPQFNLAHSGADAVIAITRGAAIGVDIELIRSIDEVESLARHVFSPIERRELDGALNSELAFLAGWTRKEAYVKALGIGCFAPLTQITVSLSRRAGLLSTGFTGIHADSVSDWSLLNVPHPRGIVALALGPLGFRAT